MKHTIKIFAAAVLIAACSFHQANAQLTVSPNKTAAQLASALVGAGVTVSNATLTCPSGANGTFSGALSPLSIADGIVLTSGSAANTASPASFFSSENNNAAGDAALSALAGQTTLDACVLEFDFVAQGDAIKFDYQFGSEEYPDYSCQVFNDVFGFFLSGPGFPSPTNIAVLPGTSTAVTINTTTGFGTCNPVHPYFINNVNGPAPAYDGLTSVLSAEANITMGATYHLKLGVADAVDRIYSSGVFLEEGSLTVAPPVISGCPGDITSCNPVVSWTEPTATSGTLSVTVSSTHNPGDVFPVGTTQVTYTFSNGFTQSTCTFNVTVLTSGLTAAIAVNPNPAVAGQLPNTIYLGYGPACVTLTASAANGTAPYSYSWSNTLSTADNQVVCPVATTTYSVTVTDDNGCIASADQTINVIDVRDGNKKIFICHNGNTLSVSVNAVPAHLAHGDMLGNCPDNARMANYGNSTTEMPVNLHPNPTNGLFTIDLPALGDVSVVVTDITGKQVFRQVVANNQQHHLDIDLAASASGLYTVKVICAENVYQFNVAKQ